MPKLTASVSLPPAITQLRRSEKEELLIILQAMLEAEDSEQATGSKPLETRLQHRSPKGGSGVGVLRAQDD